MTRRSTVLVVEDDPIGREVLEALLEGEGLELGLAQNGEEALLLAARLLPDLVLLDVMMPGMDGFEVCRRLRADPQLAEVPIVLLTGLDDRESRLRGIQAGADEFLTKPVDRIELVSRVRTVIRLNRYRRLLHERARFAWVLEHSDDGYVVLDAGGEIVEANPRARLFLGLTSSGEVSGSFPAVTESQYRREPKPAWESWPGPSQGPRYLVRPEAQNARAFWLEVEVFRSPTPGDGSSIVRLRDVTGRIGAHRDIRTFHDLVNHKLRTPLTSLVGALEILTERSGENERAEDPMLRMALGGAQRLYSQILEILGAVDDQTEAGETPISAVSNIVEQLRVDLRLERVSIDIAPEVARRVLPLAPGIVGWVLRELCVNAEKFHPGHEPEIQIELHAASPEAVTVRVTDDGVHLSPEQLAQAFSPYAQGEKHFTGELPGMGLGLFLVASRVWEAGGEVEIRNRVAGPGVVVALRLPTTETRLVIPSR